MSQTSQNPTPDNQKQFNNLNYKPIGEKLAPAEMAVLLATDEFLPKITANSLVVYDFGNSQLNRACVGYAFNRLILPDGGSYLDVNAMMRLARQAMRFAEDTMNLVENVLQDLPNAPVQPKEPARDGNEGETKTGDDVVPQ